MFPALMYAERPASNKAESSLSSETDVFGVGVVDDEVWSSDRSIFRSASSQTACARLYAFRRTRPSRSMVINGASGRWREPGCSGKNPSMSEWAVARRSLADTLFERAAAVRDDRRGSCEDGDVGLEYVAPAV